MFSGVPNLASALGYTNASWTLKCDLTCEYVCRLLNHMESHGLRQCTPRNTDPTIDGGAVDRFLLRLRPARRSTSSRSRAPRAPWKLHQNYARDLLTLRFGKLDDGAMVFSNPTSQPMTETL